MGHEAELAAAVFVAHESRELAARAAVVELLGCLLGGTPLRADGVSAIRGTGAADRRAAVAAYRSSRNSGPCGRQHDGGFWPRAPD